MYIYMYIYIHTHTQTQTHTHTHTTFKRPLVKQQQKPVVIRRVCLKYRIQNFKPALGSPPNCSQQQS